MLGRLCESQTQILPGNVCPGPLVFSRNVVPQGLNFPGGSTWSLLTHPGVKKAFPAHRWGQQAWGPHSPSLCLEVNTPWRAPLPSLHEPPGEFSYFLPNHGGTKIMLVARSHKEVFVGFLHFVRRKEGKKEEGCAWPGAMRRKEIREGRKEGKRACFDEFEIRTRTERESHTHHRS